MSVRVVAWALAGGVAVVPVAAVPQELAMAPMTAVKVPTAPPALSPDCRTRRVAGDLFRRPLRALSRAVRAKRQVRVLAIGSSSTAGVGASSASATFIAKLETSLEGSLQGMDFDVVLIDPQYGEALTTDAYYEQMVGAVAEVAREARVLLVARFEAMRELQHERGDLFYLASDQLHPNDRGHRCMAEQLARTIVGGLMQADSEQTQPVFYP